MWKSSKLSERRNGFRGYGYEEARNQNGCIFAVSSARSREERIRSKTRSVLDSVSDLEFGREKKGGEETFFSALQIPEREEGSTCEFKQGATKRNGNCKNAPNDRKTNARLEE